MSGDCGVRCDDDVVVLDTTLLGGYHALRQL